jgi:CRP-like cAMP-binding protein
LTNLKPQVKPPQDDRVAQINPRQFLPATRLAEFNKGQIVYGAMRPAPALYLIIDGRVKLSRPTWDDQSVVVEVLHADEYFGETIFHPQPVNGEQATAMDRTRVMSWDRDEIRGIALREPELAISLLQIAVRRCHDFATRLQALSTDTVAERLATALSRFAERFGRSSGKNIEIPIPLTHELLAQYVGTSREIITSDLTAMRRKGLLHYSRQGITLTPAFFSAKSTPVLTQ